MQVSIPNPGKIANGTVVGLDWYSGYHEGGGSTNPSLAVCYDNGYLILMRNATDTSKCHSNVLWFR